MPFLKNRNRLAQYLYSLDAVLGILSIAGAALYIAALSSKSLPAVFFFVFVPCSLLWASLCYGAWKGLVHTNLFFKILFWLHVVVNVFVFPVGTALAAAAIWLRRELRK